jgi:DNA-directed RNA polymerase specialized sigma24 family protein
MIDEKTFKLINDFAKAQCLRFQDADDIAQLACESILLYPPTGPTTPAFYYVVVKRAKQAFYNKNDKAIPTNELPEIEVSEHSILDMVYISELDAKFQKLAKGQTGNQGHVTKFQATIFRLMYEGMNPLEMAKHLNVSHTSTGSYVKLIYDKIKNFY